MKLQCQSNSPNPLYHSPAETQCFSREWPVCSACWLCDPTHLPCLPSPATAVCTVNYVLCLPLPFHSCLSFLQSLGHTAHNQAAFSDYGQPGLLSLAFLRIFISYCTTHVTFHSKQVPLIWSLGHTVDTPWVNHLLLRCVKVQVLLWKLKNLICILDQVEIIMTSPRSTFKSASMLLIVLKWKHRLNTIKHSRCHHVEKMVMLALTPVHLCTIESFPPNTCLVWAYTQ